MLYALLWLCFLPLLSVAFDATWESLDSRKLPDWYPVSARMLRYTASNQRKTYSRETTSTLTIPPLALDGTRTTTTTTKSGRKAWNLHSLGRLFGKRERDRMLPEAQFSRFSSNS